MKIDWRTALTAFTTLFLAELGDKTQLAAVTLSASSRQPLSVFIGGAAALALVTALGCAFGEALLRFMPEHVLRRGAALLLVAMGGWFWFK